MFKLLVFILQASMLFTVYFSLPLLFIFRLVFIIKEKPILKDSLLILLIPFSLGYYNYENDKKTIKIYNILVIILSIIAIIGILFTVYQKHF